MSSDHNVSQSDKERHGDDDGIVEREAVTLPYPQSKFMRIDGNGNEHRQSA